MINNLITYLKEEASEDAEHKIWCDTELTTNTNDRGNDRNRGEAPRYCERAQGFDGECGNGSGGILRTGVPTSRGSIQCRLRLL